MYLFSRTIAAAANPPRLPIRPLSLHARARRPHLASNLTARFVVASTVVAALLTIGLNVNAQEWARPATDAELMREALWSCKNLAPSRRNNIDLDIFAKMLQLERDYDVPVEYRGMTLAKGCIESGYTPDVHGDCKKPGECKAVGMLQLWPWTTRFGVDRTDPVDSTRFLLERVRIGLQGRRLKRRCPNVTPGSEAFRLAWLRINRGPLQNGRQRCYGVPHGLKRLRQWQRNIAKRRIEQARAHRRRVRPRTAQSATWSAAAAFTAYSPVRRL